MMIFRNPQYFNSALSVWESSQHCKTFRTASLRLHYYNRKTKCQTFSSTTTRRSSIVPAIRLSSEFLPWNTRKRHTRTRARLSPARVLVLTVSRKKYTHHTAAEKSISAYMREREALEAKRELTSPGENKALMSARAKENLTERNLPALPLFSPLRTPSFPRRFCTLFSRARNKCSRRFPCRARAPCVYTRT